MNLFFQSKKARKIILNIILVMLFIFFSNCAIFQRKNLVLVNAVEENLVPENDSAKIWASPFYIPVGILAGALDVFIVHPISVIPNAAEDTIDTLWSDKPDLGYVTRMGIVPFSLLLSGPMFALSFSYHWLFEDSSDGTDLQSEQVNYSQKEWENEIESALEANSMKKLETLLNSCNSHLKSERDVRLLIKVYEKYKNNNKVNLSNTGLYCLLAKNGYDSNIENFIVKIFLQDNSLELIYNNRNALVSYFIQYRSQKGSKVLIEMLSDENLDSRWIPFIVESIFIFGYQEERNEIINRIQRKKISI